MFQRRNLAKEVIFSQEFQHESKFSTKTDELRPL